MKKYSGMHKAQVATLHALREQTSARYVDLLNRTDMTSDVFKFHIRKLVALGYIMKNDRSRYELTAVGKDYTNRLDRTTGLQYEQPKSSLLLVVRSHANGDWRYLAHRRSREPFYGMWGIMSARVPKGVSLVGAARDALLKQTGLTAEFTVAGSCRIIDIDENDTVLEDKLFSVMVATLDSTPEISAWCGGESRWMNAEKLLAQPFLFQSTGKIIDMIENNQVFFEDICRYEHNEY